MNHQKMMQYFISIIWGIIIGFAAAVPVGPVGIICFQRTLVKNRLSGLITGFGSSCADVLLACIGAFSITIVFSFITNHQDILRILGGIFLLTIGAIGLISRTKEREVRVDTTLGLIQEFISGFILTITNPLTAIVFFVAFGNISSKIGGNLHTATLFVIGIFIGTSLWWFLLTFIADKIAHKVKHEHIVRMSKCFSIIITFLGIIILSGILLKHLI